MAVEAMPHAPADRSPPRVLVAEDDGDMRRLVVEALRKDGYDVVAVSDGGRLLVHLARDIVDPERSDLPDLIVSDVRMPVCTGIQILEQLRAAHWRMPIILMTAFGDEGTRKHATSLGALLFDKPFDLGDLRKAVARLLGTERVT
jgi:DNA-binding response OmpR family regulator